MTSRNLVTAPKGVSSEEALALLKANKIEKLPIVDAEGHLRGLITVKDFSKREEFPNASKDDVGRLRVAAPSASATTSTRAPGSSSRPGWTSCPSTPRTATPAACST